MLAFLLVLVRDWNFLASSVITREPWGQTSQHRPTLDILPIFPIQPSCDHPFKESWPLEDITAPTNFGSYLSAGALYVRSMLPRSSECSEVPTARPDGQYPAPIPTNKKESQTQHHQVWQLWQHRFTPEMWRFAQCSILSQILLTG